MKISKPRPGDPITAKLIGDIIDEVESNKLIQGHRIRCSRGPNGTRIEVIDKPRRRQTEFLHPFEVRWNGEENDGSGAWVLWAPNTAEMIQYDGSYVPITVGLTAATTLPAGWYKIPVSTTSSSAMVRVNIIRVTDQLGTSTHAEISNTYPIYPSGTGYELAFTAVVARVSYDSEDNIRQVKQLVDSLVTVGGGSGGGSGYGYTGQLVRITRLAWETYELHLYGVLDTYENGLLKTPGTEESVISTVTTVAHSTLH